MLIEQIIHQLGIYSVYRGYPYLIYAIQISLENEDRLRHVTKELYSEIARHFECNIPGIERSLRTVITQCWEYGNREYLMELAGHKLYRKPSPGEFISIVTYYVRLQAHNSSHPI